jgi:hypothetical protein
VNIRPIPTVLRSDVRPARSVDRVQPVLYAGIVARRIAIVTLLLLLLLPSLWSLVTGQYAVVVDGASGRNAIALVTSHSGEPRVGDTVAVRSVAEYSVGVGTVSNVGAQGVALHDPVGRKGWTASVADIHGVVAIYDGPVAHFLAALPPYGMSAALIVLIIALVAIPLRRSEPHAGDAPVVVPQVRHIKHFHEYSRG